MPKIEIFLYMIYALIVGVISILTHEIVAFVLLGLVFVVLNRILTVLKEISKKLDK